MFLVVVVVRGGGGDGGSLLMMLMMVAAVVVHVDVFFTYLFAVVVIGVAAAVEVILG